MSQVPSQGSRWYALLPKARAMGIVAVILIAVFSFALFFYMQELTREQIRTSVFEQHRDAQIEATRRISEHIGTDLNLIAKTVEGLTNSYYLQRGDLSSESAKALVEEKYEELSPRINNLLILDNDNIVAVSLAPPISETFLSADFSHRSWVVETRESRNPLYSDGFERQGIYRIFISYPIISRETQEILGIIAVSIPTVPYFAYYANVHDINTQYLVAFSRGGTLLAVGASQDLVGESFFAEETQNFINHDQVLNNLTRSLLEGNPGQGLYDYGRGERFTTQFPVYVGGEPLYFIQLVTPTAGIYSEVDAALQAESGRSFLLLSGTVISIAVLTVLLLKWNGSLSREVKMRTKQLADANERLEINLNAQKEFLQIAAHELRTPVQPILGIAEALRDHTNKSDIENAGNSFVQEREGELLGVILRNAQRLKRLTENLLDVSRIDSRSLRLKVERFDLVELVTNTLRDIRNGFSSDSEADVNFSHSGSVFINGDKERITQVISNLVQNSLKFMKEGTVEASITKNGSEAIITISDQGEGIHPEILPRLFVKFVSRSDGGTGLGLYISKGIIEAHGGRIWAENNIGGKGASFHFTLPLSN
ncbi:MAG: sensor histidine kinase [Nitrososphaera sp.]